MIETTEWYYGSRKLSDDRFQLMNSHFLSLFHWKLHPFILKINCMERKTIPRMIKFYEQLSRAVAFFPRKKCAAHYTPVFVSFFSLICILDLYLNKREYSDHRKKREKVQFKKKIRDNNRIRTIPRLRSGDKCHQYFHTPWRNWKSHLTAQNGQY